jgi:hypothetical protein
MICGQDRVDVKFITDSNGNNTQEEVIGDWLIGAYNIYGRDGYRVQNCGRKV